MTRTTRPRPIGAADRVARDPACLSGEIGGEVVALDVAKGACYGLDPVASRVWSLMAAPIGVDALCASLVADYEVDIDTCRADVLELLESLAAEGLIQVHASAPGASD